VALCVQKFVKKQTTFDKVIAKILKISMDPSSRRRQSLF